MRLLLSLVFFISLSYDALATPTVLRPQRRSRSFQVERVKCSNYVAHGPSALRKAYRKFGIAPTNFSKVEFDDFEPFNVKHTTANWNNQDSADGDQTGEVSAKSVQSDVEFVSVVTIGGQDITMDFDTGSADMWVFNSEMQSPFTQGRTVYHPNNSSTYTECENSEFYISYGDSSWAQGTVGKDTVSIGGATVQGQAFGLPEKVSESFIQDTYSNGLVGLGFSSLNTFKSGFRKTFFDNISPDLEEPVLTARLRSDGVGEYEFGNIDRSKYSDQLVNVSVDSSNGFWEFDAGVFAVGNGPLQNIIDTPTAIADTGTSLILVSLQMLEAYYKQVKGAVFSNSVSGYIFPCSADLPTLTVALGKKFQATIPGSLINFAEIGMNTTSGETVCYGGVQSNQGSSRMIFGDVFLKALFVVFDQRGPSLGFASPK